MVSYLWKLLDAEEDVSSIQTAMKGGDNVAKRKIEETEVSQLRDKLVEQYKDEELAAAMTEDAVKLGTVHDILEGTKNVPTLAEAKRWLENQKREKQREENR